MKTDNQSQSTSQLVSQTKKLNKVLKNRKALLIKNEKLNTKKLEKKIASMQKGYSKYSNVSLNTSTTKKHRNILKNFFVKKSKEITKSSKTSLFLRRIKKIDEKSQTLSPLATITYLSILIIIIQIAIPNNSYYIDNTNINYKMKQLEGKYSLILMTLVLWVLSVLFYIYALLFRVEPIGDFTGGEY